jgi:hypothetical protein
MRQRDFSAQAILKASVSRQFTPIGWRLTDSESDKEYAQPPLLPWRRSVEIFSILSPAGVPSVEARFTLFFQMNDSIGVPDGI